MIGVRFDVSPQKTIRELERSAREAEAVEDYRLASELRERAERIRLQLEADVEKAA